MHRNAERIGTKPGGKTFIQNSTKQEQRTNFNSANNIKKGGLLHPIEKTASPHAKADSTNPYEKLIGLQNGGNNETKEKNSESPEVHLRKEKTPAFSMKTLRKEFFGEYQKHIEIPYDVIDFVRVPWYIETFILFGQTFWFDCFLWAITIFPVRVLYGAILIITSYFSKLFKRKLLPSPSPSNCFDFICGICVILSAIIYVETGAYNITLWLGAKSALRLSAIFTACTGIFRASSFLYILEILLAFSA